MSYDKPNSNSLPFKFTSTGYTPPGHDSVAFGFNPPKSTQTGNLKAAINVMKANYQDETYSYVKECKKFIIGYNVYGVQIIKGKCVFGGVRDLGVEITGYSFISDTLDLIAHIKGTYRGPDQNLPAYVKVFQQGQKDLPGFLRGLLTNDLPSTLYPIPPKDLPAYLKPWPQRDLPGNIHGWEERDLGGDIYAYQFKDLPARIFAEGPKNLAARLKGWAREVIADLGGNIRGLTYEGLQALIRCKYLADLPGYIGAVEPKNLPASLYGWQELDLGGILTGVYGDYDLQAYINATGNYKNLNGYVLPVLGKNIPGNLPAYIFGSFTGDLSAIIGAIEAGNLPAYLNVLGASGDLGASIYPKFIRLAGLVSVSTLANRNLYATINSPCGASAPKDLLAYLNVVYKSELGAYIKGLRSFETAKNLGATINIENSYLTLDKLPISIILNSNVYKVLDKLPIYISMYREFKGLSASITGILTSKNLGATITADYLDAYNFENPKYKEIVRKFTYNSIEESFQVVELSFKSIVEDMFYVSATNEIVKSDRLDKWVLDVRSFFPADAKLNIKRKLHRLKYLYDMEDFESFDEAMRYAIDYVTEFPTSDLGTRIQASGGFKNLGINITGIN
jgi:hypothetical protein